MFVFPFFPMSSCFADTYSFGLQYCLILNDHFESLDDSIWTHEVQVDGFGDGSFQWTTTDPSNAFTDEEGLHIVPTLTVDTTSITNQQINTG